MDPECVRQSENVDVVNFHVSLDVDGAARERARAKRVRVSESSHLKIGTGAHY